MSPLGQLSSYLGNHRGIDRDFNHVLSYVDELDRHFSHRHHLVNCVVPRFDLEEDSQLYYLYGEVPGAKADDIAIEPRDKNTLVICGTIHRPDAKTVKANDPLAESTTEGTSTKNNTETQRPILTDKVSHGPQHTHSLTREDGTTSYIPLAGSSKPSHRTTHKTLLNERLLGDFHRTFIFPTPVVEEAVQATLDDGILTVLIPKMERSSIDSTKRIPIMHGT